MSRKHRKSARNSYRGGDTAADIGGEGIRVRPVRGDAGVAEAHRRFGGVDGPATLAGVLAAVGALVLLSGLMGAAGSIGYQLGADDDDLSIGGIVAGIAVLLLSFFIGGWVAGRVARYDGGRNGIVTVLWFLLLAAGLAALGAWAGDEYNLFDRPDLDLPNWFSSDDLGVAAVVSAVGGALLALLAGWLGGIVGARYHRRADAVVSATRDGGVAYPETAAPAGVAGRGEADLTTSGRVTDAAPRRGR